MSRINVTRLFLMIFILTIFGCSGGGDKSVMPDIPGSPGFETPGEQRIENTNEGSPRMLWGIWTIQFDPLNRSIEVIPVRVSALHIDITEMILPPACDDCFEIAVNGFDTVTRILDADVTLNNPYAISGRDVRGILFTNELGHLLTNPDDWTGLWDPPGGSSLNPFIAFAKSEPSRIFAGGAEHSENFLVYIPLPPAYNSITFAVDASYPGNCKEPYSIANFQQEVQLFDITNSSTPVSVDVLDWQGDVSKVTLVAPEITGASFSPMVFEGGATWSYELINSAGAPEGEYDVRIIADSTNSPEVPLYDYATVVIEHTVVPTVTDIDPVIGTSGFEYTDLLINGTNFINSAIQVNLKMDGEPDIAGINAFSDISTVMFDLDIPVSAAPGLYDVEVKNWTGAFGIGEDLFEVTVLTPEIYEIFPQSCQTGGYLSDVIVGGWNIQGPGIEVTLKMDGEPDIEAVSINSWTEVLVKCDLSIPSEAAVGGYDVVLKSGNNIEVILEESFFVTTDDPSMDFVNITPDWLNFFPSHVVSDGGYVYTTGRVNGLHIWDISTPGDPTWVSKVDPNPDFIGSIPKCEYVAVSDGYAYVNLRVENDYEGQKYYLMVADIDPPESASVLTYFPFDSYIGNIAVDGTYAYIMASEELLILDISTPASPSIIKQVSDAAITGWLTYDNGYVYIAALNNGVLIFDVDPVETASFIKTVDTSGNAFDVVVDGGYAYVADEGAICIIPIEPPESAYVLKSVDVPPEGNAKSIAVSSGYAYVVGTKAPLQIFDVDLPIIAHHVKSVSLNAYSRDVSVFGNTAYVVCNATGLYAIDITDPLTASITNVQYTPGQAGGLDFANDVLYVANGAAGVYAYDVATPASINLLTALDTGNAQDIVVDGVYAYLAEGWDFPSGSYLRILDIEPVESMSIYNSASVGGWPRDIEFDNGYAFIEGSGDTSLMIYDVVPQETILSVGSVGLPSYLRGFAVENGYAYMACQANALMIADIDPPGDASIIATLATDYEGRLIALDGDYAYVIDTNSSLMQIIDVATPDSPSVVKVMGIPGRPGCITVQDGYAYIGSNNDGPGLAVVDVDPYDTAYVLTVFDMLPYGCGNVIKAGNYIYITSVEEGLHILEVI